jgi:hypothetical protein
MFVSEIFDECAEILGTTDVTKVFRKITQAVQTLMESGHWTHTTAEVDVCTGWDKCTITLPRGIDVPLAVNIDGSPTYFRNRLFQYHVNKGGMYNPVSWAWDDRGYVSTIMDIIRPSQLIAVAESNNDVGKMIRVLGTDQNNRDLRSQLQNGTGVDGLLIPIHSQQDFATGTIIPDDSQIRTRDVSITPITNFTTTAPHGLSSGQEMDARLISGTIPVPLNNGQTYYIGVIDAYTVQLFSDSLNAQALQYPIALQSIQNFGSMQLEDKRTSQVETSLKFVPPSPIFSIDSPNEIVFPVQSLPAPLEAQKTYFAQPIDADHIQIFPSLVDATNNTNPVYLTGSTSAISVDIRKPIIPETKLVFSVKHYFNDGDQVQATTNGGSLPQPLLVNQNYFVNIIDDFSVSLHLNRTDAINSDNTNFINPVQITTSGSGIFSIVKLIAATATTGTQSQITAPTLSIGTPSGVNALFTPVVVGSVVGVNVTNAGTNYTTTPIVTFDPPPQPPVGSGSLIEIKTAQGYATRNSINNTITGIVITDPGMGYSSAPNVFIAPPTTAPSIAIKTLTANQTLATCITTSAHVFETGNTVEISGATPPIYNGSFSITKTGSTSFTYALPLSLGSPLPITNIKSGTITVSSMTQNEGSPNQYRVTVNATAHGFNVGDYVYIKGATSSNGFTIDGRVQIISSGFSANVFRYIPSTLDDYGTITGTIRTWKPFDQITNTETSNTLATAACVNHGFNINQSVYVDGATIPGLNGQVNVEEVVPNVSFKYQVAPDIDSYVGTIATVFGSPATGTNLLAKIPASSAATATCSIQTSFVSYYTQSNGGSGYVDEPIIEIKPLIGGTGATARATISGGQVTKLTPITSGSGYLNGAIVTITPSTNVFVNFSSTGSLPNPLLSGTAYRAETPLNQGTGTFTVRNSDFSEVNITSTGNGTLYVVLSRTFSVAFTNNWLGDFKSFSNSQQIYFGTDYFLPITTPSIDNGITPFYLKFISNTVAEIYENIGLTTLIQITAFGTGQTYYALRTQVTPSVETNLIKPTNLSFFSENQVVQFSSSSTLPSPLSVLTDYTIKIIGNAVAVYYNSIRVILLDSGIGQLSLNVIRNVNVQKSNSIIANSSLYETGAQVVVRPKENDVLPVGLDENSAYYVRRLNNDSFELYDSIVNAQGDTTTGIKEFETSGKYVNSTFFVDAISDPMFVKTISHIEKPLTDGYVSLYAWDYFRETNMTLIGQYHPTEVNPKYRRVRIGKKCAWARILYKVTPPKVSSIYDFIPLEQERAIIAAVHAVDLEDKDFADQAVRYWGIAYQYLRNQQESIDGHAMTPPQINNITYGDGTDYVMW